jgi:phenylalanyl-tRNA synthetase beta chain
MELPRRHQRALPASRRVGEFWIGEGRVAVVGDLHPETEARFEIDAPTAILVVDLEALARLPRRDPQYREVSYHPSVRRDLAVLLDSTAQAGEVLEAIRKTGGASLASVDVFDRWEGRGFLREGQPDLPAGLPARGSEPHGFRGRPGHRSRGRPIGASPAVSEVA